MLVIGLTGGIGSGKSAACQVFSSLGVPVIDTDEISRSLTQVGAPTLKPIRKAFGDGFFQSDGALDRARLRQRVFSSPVDKLRLESILHPLIRQDAVRQLASLKSNYAIIAVPLLLEAGAYNDLIQRVLLIDCPEQQQIERVMKRSAISEAEVKAIMSNQASRQARIQAADDIIVNDGTLDALKSKVQEMHRSYQKLAGLNTA